jgi:hypothetical protein
MAVEQIRLICHGPGVNPGAVNEHLLDGLKLSAGVGWVIEELVLVEGLLDDAFHVRSHEPSRVQSHHPEHVFSHVAEELPPRDAFSISQRRESNRKSSVHRNLTQPSRWAYNRWIHHPHYLSHFPCRHLKLEVSPLSKPTSGRSGRQ